MTVKDALKLYSPEAIRYFILSSHYRGPVDFSEQALQAAQTGINRFYNTVRKLRRRMKDVVPFTGAGTAALANVTSLEDYRDDFKSAMDDDFNTPQALATLFELVKEVNRTLDDDQSPDLGTLSTMNKIINDLAGDVLGILPDTLETQPEDNLVDDLVESLLAMRQEFRAENNWQKADEIRHRLSDMGIAIEDGADSTTWRLQ